MSVNKDNRRNILGLLSMGALFVLCGILGVLQYRWIGEVSIAARERLKASLQASLNQLSQELDREAATAASALMSGPSQPDRESRENAIAEGYLRWKTTARYNQLIKRVALVTARGRALSLRSLDLGSAKFMPAEWPVEWSAHRNQILARVAERPPVEGGWEPAPSGNDLVIERPIFERPPERSVERFFPQEPSWLLVELNEEYIQATILPALLHRYLGSSGHLEYVVEVTTRSEPPRAIYRSDPGQSGGIGKNADATVTLLDVGGRSGMRGELRDGFFGRGMREEGAASRWPGRASLGPRQGRGPSGGPGNARGGGRWQLSVRHISGSLDAAVSKVRYRNLAVTAAVLLLMLATSGSLIRYTRQAQRLAEMQIGFVAGVSHELRTPLTVMRTLAYNLRGKMAHNPAQVEKYGDLIERESAKLTTLVEQVMQFAGMNATQNTPEPKAVRIEKVIIESLNATRSAVNEARCRVEENIDTGLPDVLGDATALQHVLQNLIGNAAKYGKDGGWIRISAHLAKAPKEAVVEIRVADGGPGISSEERERIFDPFFRGKQAVHDQIHGTGLGLSLARQIVEAHGGTIELDTRKDAGAEFVVRLPAAPPGVTS
jgi:signal transduction histidine kinase